MVKERESSSIRPSWDDYFLELADAASKRATCGRGRSGCVIVRDKQVLVTGYVGSPTGLPHCDDVGHLIKSITDENGETSEHCLRTVHSEQNAICQAAKRGISIEGATLYTRMTPCRTCAMLLINCGIERVVCERKYHQGQESESMLADVGVKLEYKYSGTQQYEKQPE
ncbi:MAG: cytidine/deoxycytidylate deaminase family protein [Dehalococcoidales bacterium]